MNKAELVDMMAKKSNLTKKETESALNAFLNTVEETLVLREKVQLVGFGTFETKERKPREGRNPRKPDEVIKIPGSIQPVFRPGKKLKDLLNNK